MGERKRLRRRYRTGRIATWIALAAGTFPAVAAAQGVTFTPFASGSPLSSITDIAHAGDSRLFVALQRGRIFIVQSNGTIVSTPFLDIADRVHQGGGERGLLGLAFHPDYATNGYFYVNYNKLDGDKQISRFSVSDEDPNVADPDSELPILDHDQPFSNHNGGDLNFGPDDGYLYIATGDGGSGCDPSDAGQDPLTFLGKILRIDVDGGTPYAIPASNPFVGDPEVLDEIWSLGLRNPWRFAFDRQAPHDIWIADVGQGQREEVNHRPGNSPGGENYEWDCKEGTANASISGCSTEAVCPVENGFEPVNEYDHNDGRCSITGGFIYRGSAQPGFVGEYFYADFCSRRMWSLRKEGNAYVETLYSTLVPGGPRTFGEDANGEVYVATGSAIYRIEDPTPPVSGCPDQPADDCDEPDQASLIIRDRLFMGPSIKDRLSFSFVKGPATTQQEFGAPTQDTDYLFCLYAGDNPERIAEAGVSAGGTCGGQPCWSPIANQGWKFTDSSASQAGTQKILLKGDPNEPKTRVQWRGKDATLPTPMLPVSEGGSLSVRVHNSTNSNCWGADFQPPFDRNDETTLKAKTQ